MERTINNTTNNSVMKITIINGSPRKNGATAKLLKRMASYLEQKPDIDVIYIDLVDYSLQYCTGCMSCYRSGLCHLKDEVEEINKSVSESKGLIIGSPTYSSSMPGLLKTYIDRGHFVLEQSLNGKYAFALNTYEIAGGTSVISALKTLYRYSGAVLCGSYACKLPFNSSPFENSPVETTLLKKTEKFYKALRESGSKSVIDRVISYIALYLIIKPQVLKRPAQYKAVIERWRELGIYK